MTKNYSLFKSLLNILNPEPFTLLDIEKEISSKENAIRNMEEQGKQIPESICVY